MSQRGMRASGWLEAEKEVSRLFSARQAQGQTKVDAFLKMVSISTSTYDTSCVCVLKDGQVLLKHRVVTNSHYYERVHSMEPERRHSLMYLPHLPREG
jgi:hypothetical protein